MVILAPSCLLFRPTHAFVELGAFGRDLFLESREELLLSLLAAHVAITFLDAKKRFDTITTYRSWRRGRPFTLPLRRLVARGVGSDDGTFLGFRKENHRQTLSAKRLDPMLYLGPIVLMPFLFLFEPSAICQLQRSPSDRPHHRPSGRSNVVFVEVPLALPMVSEAIQLNGVERKVRGEQSTELENWSVAAEVGR